MVNDRSITTTDEVSWIIPDTVKELFHFSFLNHLPGYKQLLGSRGLIGNTFCRQFRFLVTPILKKNPSALVPYQA